MSSIIPKYIKKYGYRERAITYTCIYARIGYKESVEPLGTWNFGTHEKAERNGMRERIIEVKLIKEVKLRGGLALKLNIPGFDGMPDRLVLFPHGKLAFIELKAPGKHPRPLQEKRKRQLEALGFRVFCIDDPGQIGGILDEITSGL